MQKSMILGDKNHASAILGLVITDFYRLNSIPWARGKFLL